MDRVRLDACAAIHEENLASDIGCRIAREEHNGFGHILGIAFSSKGDFQDKTFANVVGEIFRHIGLNEAWSDHVYRNAPGREFLGQGFREAYEPRFSGGIVGLSALTS